MDLKEKHTRRLTPAYYREFILGSNNSIVYATTFRTINDSTKYTQLKEFSTVGMNYIKLEDGFAKNPFLNIEAFKLIKSTYSNQGGYILIGEFQGKAKVIKVNRIGQL